MGVTVLNIVAIYSIASRLEDLRRAFGEESSDCRRDCVRLMVACVYVLYVDILEILKCTGNK